MLKRIFTCLLVLSVTYLLVSLFHIAAIKYGAEAMGYGTHTTFGFVELSPKEYQYWNIWRVLGLHAFPSLFLLLIGIIILSSLRIKNISNSFIRFVLFWLMIWCVLLNVSELIVAPFGMITPEKNPMFQDYAVVAPWFGIPPFLMAILGVAGVGFSILLGFMSANYFFSCGYSRKARRDTGERRFWLISMFYIPVVIALPLSLLCSWPAISVTHLVMSAAALLVGVGMSLYSELRQADTIKIKRDITDRFSLDFLLLFAALIVCVRVFIHH